MPNNWWIQKPRQLVAQKALTTSTTPATRSKLPTTMTVASVAMNHELIAARPTRMSKTPTTSMSSEYLRKVCSALPSKSAESDGGGDDMVFLATKSAFRGPLTRTKSDTFWSHVHAPPSISCCST